MGQAEGDGQKLVGGGGGGGVRKVWRQQPSGIITASAAAHLHPVIDPSCLFLVCAPASARHAPAITVRTGTTLRRAAASVSGEESAVDDGGWWKDAAGVAGV